MLKYIYLYILKCNDNSYYTGVTNNLDKRLKEHNLGINPESYTYSRRPLELVYSEAFTNFNLAFEWETKIKKWSKAKKEALINGEFDNLPELSKKKFKNKEL
jgi:putative endonuclease